MAIRNLLAEKAATYAIRVADPSVGTTAADNDEHMAVGKTSSREISALIKFTMDWTNVKKITKAELVTKTYNVGGEHLAVTPQPSSRVSVYMLSGSFLDNNVSAEGAYVAGAYNTVIPKNTNYTGAGIISSTHNADSRIDITSLLNGWAPSSVAKSDGTPGANITNHGLVVVRRPVTGQLNPQSLFYSDKHPGAGDVFIELTYDPIPSLPDLILTGPISPVTQVAGEFFEGDFLPGTASDVMTRVHIELFLEGGALQWQKNRAVTASEAESGHFSEPLPALLRSGIAYEWRARVQDSQGEVSLPTAKTDLLVSTAAPVLSQLAPGGTHSTLDGVYFGAHYQDDNPFTLLEYRIQVGPGSLFPGDPLWDDLTTELFWDTGVVSASEPEVAPYGRSTSSGTQFNVPGLGGVVVDRGGVIRRLYGGKGLPAGSYDYRIKAWDTLGAESLWYYGTFTLTTGWEPDPGETEFLSGYANRQVRARILIRDMNLNQQRVYVHNANGGTFKLDYNGSLTAAMAYNISAADMKTQIDALTGISTVTVAKVGTYYTIDFNPDDNITEELLPSALALTGTGATVHTWHTRGPGKRIAVIEDAANIGAAEFYNSAGEFFFTLPAIHPQVAVIEPWQVHWALEVYRGEGWKEINAGLIVDFDATEDDVVFYGFDYMGIGALDVDERFNPEATPDLAAVLFPTAGGGSKYVNKDIDEVVTDQLNRMIYGIKAPLGFMSLGAVDPMDEKVTIFSTFKQRIPFIAGLIESHRAGTGKRTRVRIRKEIDGTYEIRVDDNPGFDRDNLRMEYGGLVQGFRAVPFGDFATRVNAIGRAFNALKVDYVITPTPVPTGEPADFNERIYGRFPHARLWQDITDLNDLKRRAKQEAKRIGKVGKQLGIALRVDALGVKDGWDITDSIPVAIKRGVVDVERFGSGYYTIWGWTFRVYPDGHTDLVLSLLPREDDEAADVDLIPSSPINVGSEWDIGWNPPVAGVDIVRYFLDQNTGIVYERQEDGSYDVIGGEVPGDTHYPPPPEPPTSVTVSPLPPLIRPDGTTGVGGTVEVTHSPTVGSRGTFVQATTREVSLGVPDWDRAQSAEVLITDTKVTFDSLDPGSVIYVRGRTRSLFGTDSAWSAVDSEPVPVDTTAPATPTGLTLVGGVLNVRATWNANTEDDINHYDVQVDDDPGFGSPVTYSVYVTNATLSGLAPGVWNVRVRAVDHTGNASAYSSIVSASSRFVETGDVDDEAITTTKIADDSITTPKVRAGAIHVGQTMGAGANLVPNHSFEIDPGVTYADGSPPPGWGVDNLNVTAGGTYDAGFGIETGASTQRTSARHLRHTQPNPVAAHNADSVPMPVVAGRRYRWRAWIRGTTGNNAAARARLNVLEYDATGAQVVNTTVSSGVDTVGAGTTWTEISGTIVLGATSTWVRLRCNVGAVGSVGDIVRWDDLEFYPTDYDISHAAGNVLIDATGVTINDGKLTFNDDYGSTALTGGGFGATWQRFLQAGFFNGDFVALPPSGGSDIDNSTNPLPNWPFTKSSGTAITARSVAATSNGSQRACQFTMASGAANDKSFIEQVFPISATKNRAFSFSPYAHIESSAGNADAEAFVELQFLKKDLTTTGSAYTGFIATSVVAGAGGYELSLPDASNSAPPADAYYARVRFGLRRKSGGSNAATSTMQFNETLMLEGKPRTHVPEVSAPSTYSRGTIMQINGSMLLIPDGADLNPTGRKSVGIGGDGVGMTFGSSVPDAPNDGDLWYEGDEKRWWVYMSAHSVWVSADTFLHGFTLTKAVSLPFSATQTGIFRQVMPYTGSYGLIVDRVFTSFHVQGGGTALGASHKWVGQVVRDTGGVLATINVDSGSSAVWRRDSQSLSQVYASSFFIHEINWTKTGTPGNLYAHTDIEYRLIRP